jgi:hypothetical protein
MVPQKRSNLDATCTSRRVITTHWKWLSQTNVCKSPTKPFVFLTIMIQFGMLSMVGKGFNMLRVLFFAYYPHFR